MSGMDHSLRALLRRYHEPPEVPEDLLWMRIQAQQEQERARYARTTLRWPALLRPGIAAAAAIVLLVGVSLFVPPVRAWITTQATAPFNRSEVSHEEAVAPPPEGQRIRVAVPTEGVLLVSVLHCQKEGMLQIEVHQAPEVVLETARSHNAARLVTSPGELRVHNQPGSAGSYRLSVPPFAGFVWLRLGRAQPVRLPETATPGASWLFHLQDGATTHGAHCTE